MDRNEQLVAARELAQTFDAASDFYGAAVVSKDFGLLSAGDLVAIFNEVHGLNVPQPEPTQENTASSASHHPAE